MSIGNFSESREGSDNNESRMENSEKKNEQKTESSEQRNENVDSKMDEHESKQEKQSDNKESKKDSSEESEKQGVWDKLKSFFKKDGGEDRGEKSDDGKEDSADKSDPVKSFKDRMKEGAPSMEQQAADAKKMEGRDEYLRDREMSDRANEQNPNRKSWEMSSEQKAAFDQGTKEVLDKYRSQN